MIDVSARSLNQVVYCLIVHIGGANACQLFSVLTGIVCGNDTGTVKAVQSNNLQVLDLDGIARLYSNATVFRNAPFYPGFYRLLRSNEGYRNLFSALIGRGHSALDYMCCPLCRHMILMVMGCQNCVYMLKSKRVNDKGYVSQVRLHQTSAAHICHLMARLHLVVAMGSLTISAPQVDGDIGVGRRLKPYAGTSQPPHSHVSGRYNLVLDIFYEPGSPLREGAFDPAVSCHFANLGHFSNLPFFA